MDNRLLIYGQPSYLLEKTSITARKPKADSFFLSMGLVPTIDDTGYKIISKREAEGYSKILENLNNISSKVIYLDTFSKPKEVEEFEGKLKKWLNDGIDRVNSHSVYVHDKINPWQLTKKVI